MSKKTNHEKWKNEEIKGKSRWPDCMANKSFFDKKSTKVSGIFFLSQFLINWII